ncbi:hypothetical protein LPJ53_006394 [Coemansia erecta]|uniref:Uncharacterized protein n=1 Tax=Coemansia erecta TaxID=147472 RepID=A0A9W7XSS0_9FUNG|nr:hypothetical protein LPJ53_006394 [Coemansia erecta]
MSTYGERYSEHHGDPGQSSSGPARADGYTHGCGKDSSHAHPHHRSVPDMHPSGYNQQRHEGRPDEYEKSYMDQPYHGYNEPPHYSDPRGPYENHSVAGDGSRGLKDMFYKKPPADYSGVYGADYKPEISHIDATMRI